MGQVGVLFALGDPDSPVAVQEPAPPSDIAVAEPVPFTPEDPGPPPLIDLNVLEGLTIDNFFEVAFQQQLLRKAPALAEGEEDACPACGWTWTRCSRFTLIWPSASPACSAP